MEVQYTRYDYSAVIKRSAYKKFRLIVPLAGIAVISAVFFWVMGPGPVPALLHSAVTGGPEPKADTVQGDIILEDYSMDSLKKISAASQPLKTHLQSKLDEYLKRYKSQHCFVLVQDGSTNEILAWGQRKDNKVSAEPGYMTQATFPAASLIKVVTGVASLESGFFNPETPIPHLGNNHTLFYFQLRKRDRYSGPTLPLKEAFGHSVNPAFGIIGQELGGAALLYTGKRFGFTLYFPDNIPNTARFNPPDSGFHLAEVASGFTKSTTVSPLMIASMTRSLVMQQPVELPWNLNLMGKYTPKRKTHIRDSRFQPTTYQNIRTMMIETVENGTARKSMWKQIPGMYRGVLEMGGKTGSLDGLNPPGRYEWYSGYAQLHNDPHRTLIITVMQVHQYSRPVKSAQLAALLTADWLAFSPQEEKSSRK